jgi:hypothetical protein
LIKACHHCRAKYTVVHKVVGFSLKVEAEPRAKLGTPTEQSLLLQVLKEQKYESNYCMYWE